MHGTVRINAVNSHGSEHYRLVSEITWVTKIDPSLFIDRNIVRCIKELAIIQASDDLRHPVCMLVRMMRRPPKSAPSALIILQSASNLMPLDVPLGERKTLVSWVY